MLELGGKAPVLVFPDADMARAAEGIATAGYFNAGQDCTAATRVLAAPGVHDELVAALAEQARDAGEDDVTVYAFARVGYHRSLDRLRGNGWKGWGPVPASHEPNQGVLKANADRLRARLRDQGHGDNVPD